MTVPSDRRAVVSPPGGARPDRLRARLFVDGAWADGAAGTRPVVDKYRGETIGSVDQASREQVDAAVIGARRSVARTPLGPQPRYPPPLRTAAPLRPHHRAP